MKALPLLLCPWMITVLVAQTPQPRPAPVPPVPLAIRERDGIAAPEPLPAPTAPALPLTPGAASQPVSPEAPVPTSASPPRVAVRATVSRARKGEAANADTTAAGVDKLLNLFEGDTLLPRTTKTGRALVVQSHTPDAAALINAEEDLSVMALLLRKATGAARTDDRRMALGIEVDSTVFGSSSGARNIYLDGYGALFLLAVRLPLLPAPEKSEEKESKPAVSDNWAQAREEYLNSSSQGQVRAALDQVLGHSSRGAGAEYDADKVEELKNALLVALKDAVHLRLLKPTDYVTVVIQGGEQPQAQPQPEKRTTRGNGGRGRTELREDTVMSVRVKQSDVEAFAKGGLDLDAFRKRAAIHLYTRRGESSVATAGFFGPAR